MLNTATSLNILNIVLSLNILNMALGLNVLIMAMYQAFWYNDRMERMCTDEN